jgi:predicted ATP-grasp superfamily ATP-dependent carboligase
MTSAPGPTAFVLDINVFGGLGAVRSLGRAGVPVVGLGTDPRRFGFATRFCTPKQCPNPVTQPAELVAFLREEGRRLDEPGILLPASDEFVLFLARHGHDLAGLFRFNRLPPEIVEAGIDKRLQYELAERLGIPYPQTFYSASLADAHEFKDRLQYPALIKGRQSFLWRAHFPKLGKGVKVHDATELIRVLADILPSGVPIMVQTIVPGPNTQHTNVRAYVAESGEILAVFTSRKLRQYPVEFGVGTMAESVHDPELLELGLRFFRGSGFRGFGYIEFKRDPRDGTPRMIELNARFSAQIIHSTDCGVNFPLIQYLDLAGRAPAPQMSFKTGVRWLSAVGDLRSAWAHWRAGQLTPWQWLRSWASARSFAVFAWDDPKPFARYLLTLPAAELRRPIAQEQPAAFR